MWDERASLWASVGDRVIPGLNQRPVGAAGALVPVPLPEGDGLLRALGMPTAEQSGIDGLISGNKVDVLVDTDNVVTAMERDLARVHGGAVNFEIYGWTNTGTGARLTKAFMDARARGVEVNVILDQNGGRAFPGGPGKEFIEQLRSAGVNVQVQPLVQLPGAGKHVLPGTGHRKLLLMQVEGRPIAYTGGMNFSEAYDTWHDVMVRIEGPAVGSAADTFAERWASFGQAPSLAQQQLQQAAHSVAPIEDAGAAVRMLTNTPRTRGRGLELTRHVIDEARRAEHLLWVETPLLTSPRMIDELVAAAQRTNPRTGLPIDVRVLVPAAKDAAGVAQGNPKIMHTLGRGSYSRLLDAGVKIYEQPEMAHQKLLRRDNVFTVSSFNLCHRSVAKDFELGAAIVDTRVAATLHSKFLEDIARARPIVREDVASRGTRALAKVVEHLRIRL